MKSVVKVCPKCKSLKVKTNYRYGLTFLTGIPEIHTCQDCGYTAEVFPEADVDIKKDKTGDRRKKRSS